MAQPGKFNSEMAELEVEKAKAEAEKDKNINGIEDNLLNGNNGTAVTSPPKVRS